MSFLTQDLPEDPTDEAAAQDPTEEAAAEARVRPWIIFLHVLLAGVEIEEWFSRESSHSPTHVAICIRALRLLIDSLTTIGAFVQATRHEERTWFPDAGNNN